MFFTFKLLFTSYWCLECFVWNSTVITWRSLSRYFRSISHRYSRNSFWRYLLYYWSRWYYVIQRPKKRYLVSFTWVTYGIFYNFMLHFSFGDLFRFSDNEVSFISFPLYQQTFSRLFFSSTKSKNL